MNPSSSSSTPAAASRAVARPLREEPVLGARAEARDAPRNTLRASITDLHTVGPALAERKRVCERVVGEHLGERDAHRGERERVAGEGAADAADVAVRTGRGRPDPVRDVRGHAVGRRREPGRDRLADGQQVGLEPVRARVPAGTGADRVGLVDDEQRARSRRVMSRNASW